MIHPYTSSSTCARTSTTTRATIRTCRAANWASSSFAAKCCVLCASTTRTGGRRSAPTRRPSQVCPASCQVPPTANRSCNAKVIRSLKTLASRNANRSKAAASSAFSASPNGLPARTPSHPSLHLQIYRVFYRHRFKT